MTTFTIDETNNITAFASAEEAAAATTTPFDSFSTREQLAELATAWPSERLLAIWNSLPGVTPAKGVKSADAALKRIWERIQSLATPEPKPEHQAKGGEKVAKGAPAKGKSDKKTTPAKTAPKTQKPAKAREADTPREGSKQAQVVAMLQRKGGATLVEIMEKMCWQRHTVRGFMAGAMKKAGFNVESFKPEGGERTYRIK